MSATWPFRRNQPMRAAWRPNLGIAARSAAVSAGVVFVAFALAGAGLDVVLYRTLLAGVDDATAARVRHIAVALQSHPINDLDGALLATDQQVIAIQLIDRDGRVVARSGAAPGTPLVPTTEFDLNLRRGMSDDAVANDDMRVS